MSERPAYPNNPQMQSGDAPSHNYFGYSQNTNERPPGSVDSNGTDIAPPVYGGGRTGADAYYAGSQPSYQPSYQPAPSPVPSGPAPSYSFGGAQSSATAFQGSQAPSYAQYPATPTPTARTTPWGAERSDAISFATNALNPVTPYVPDPNATSAAYAQLRPSAAQTPYGQQPSATRPTDYTANNSHQQGRGQGGGQRG
ncbi:hypothetical protein [Streptomyces niveus]|uniref:hypothetical protein n=1 Tax=Streptomyces niveus TaxID=193462 RepID=UPI0036EC1D74